MRCDYARAGREPALEELLRDPVVQLVMRRDGLERRDVERAIAVVRRRLFPTVNGGGILERRAEQNSLT
jgi:hypothetical protein